MLKKIKIDKHTFSLFFLVISTVLLSQSYNAAISFAQTEPGSAGGVTPGPTESILVCEFVQFCSNPVELSTNDNDTADITPVTPQRLKLKKQQRLKIKQLLIHQGSCQMLHQIFL